MSEDKPLDVKSYDEYAPNPDIESFDRGPLASVSGIEISQVRMILKACNGKTMREIMDRLSVPLKELKYGQFEWGERTMPEIND